MRSGKPVTNQVTTPPVGTRPGQYQSDSVTAVNEVWGSNPHSSTFSGP
jgi:hypothetical protein